MDRELIEEFGDCFFYSKTAGKAYDNAVGILDRNFDKIDFDDEDDIEDLFEIIQHGLNYEDDNRVSHGEVGIKFLDYLISKGFDINFKLLQRECLILYLAKDGWIEPEIFGRVVALGADVYSETHTLENVLSRVCRSKKDGNTEELAIYIAEHYDISAFDHPDGFGYTPLMYAISRHKSRAAKVLIERGCNVNLTGGQSNVGDKTYGVSPFALACRVGDFETAKLLLEKGADEGCCDAEGIPASFRLVYLPDKYEFGQLSFAQQDKIFERKTQIVSLLKDLEKTDCNGNTLLMKALIYTHPSSSEPLSPYRNRDIISKLIERGANVNAANNEGKRPLHLAVENDRDFIKPLLAAGADVNAQDAEGNTALILECLQATESVARMLIRKGADFRIRNNKGKTAQDIALEEGLVSVLELME